jgi:hypothetical protein
VSSLASSHVQSLSNIRVPQALRGFQMVAASYACRRFLVTVFNFQLRDQMELRGPTRIPFLSLGFRRGNENIDHCIHTAAYRRAA